MAEFAKYGWMVKVLTKLEGKFQPVEQWFTAGFHDATGAETAVREYPGIEPHAVVKAHRQLSEAELKSMQVEPGKAKQYA